MTYKIAVASLLTLPWLALSLQVLALPNCSSAGPGGTCFFTNVIDYQGQTFDHLTFDPVNERSLSSIAQKFTNISSISTSSILFRYAIQASPTFGPGKSEKLVGRSEKLFQKPLGQVTIKRLQ